MTADVLRRSPFAVALLGAALAGTAACDDGYSPTPSLDIRLEKTAEDHGDAQIDTVLRTLAAPLRVRVIGAAGPAAGVAIRWTASDGTASSAPMVTSSDALGIASLAWTLGAVPGTQVMEASVTGVGGSPVTFTATAKAHVLDGASVSNPVVATTPETESGVPASGATAALVESAPAAAYVSLPPGTVAGAVRATVRHPVSKVFVVRDMVDGGFDPVSLPARPGDELEVEFELEDGSRSYYSIRVPVRRRPRVVRVAPPPRKRDVPLNSYITVVFTEPMSAGSVNGQTVRLMRDDATITSRITLSPDGLRAEIVPDEVLAANTTYAIVVDADARDLDGEQVEDAITSDFTTGDAVGAPASLTIDPGAAAVLADTHRVESRVQLTATARDAAGSPLRVSGVSWTTSNFSVATVDSEGLVIGWRPGTAVITAATGGVAGSTTITVLPRIADVSIKPVETVLQLGDTINVSVSIVDSLGHAIGAYDRVWSASANSELVIVSSAGNGVTARAVKTGNARLNVAFQPPAGTGSGWIAGEWGAQVAVTSPFPAAFLEVLPETIRTVPYDDAGGALATRARVTDKGGNEILLFSPSVLRWTSSDTSIVRMSNQAGFGGVHNGHAYNYIYPIAPGTAVFTVAGHGVAAKQTVIVEALTMSDISWGVNYYGCVLTAAGNAYCQSSANQYGEAGYGSAGNTVNALVRVAGAHRFTALTSSFGFSCGLTQSGDAYCWGKNWIYPGSFGLLGTGARVGLCNPDDSNDHVYDCSAVPVRVASDAAFTALDAGFFDHVCALSIDGGAYCWGQNAGGQLGDGTTTNRSSPATVSTTLRFTRITAGGSHSCGLTQEGSAYCWGDNRVGQLGDGTLNPAATPVAVAGGHTFVDINAGVGHTCAVSVAGAVFCWGQDQFVSREWADPAVGSTTPVAVPLPGGVSVKSVDAGWSTTCAVATSGAAYCWGYTYNLAGTEVVVIPPTKVAGDIAFASVRGGYFTSCGITSEPAVYCWRHPDETPERLQGQKP